MIMAIIAMTSTVAAAATLPMSNHGTCVLGSVLGPTVFVGWMVTDLRVVEVGADEDEVVEEDGLQG